MSAKRFQLPAAARTALPCAVLGLFAARALYELDPLTFSPLGDWPGALLLALAGMLLPLLLLSADIHSPLAARLAALDTSPLLLTSLYIVWPSVNLGLAAALFAGALALIALRRAEDLTSWVGLACLAVYLLTLGDHVGRADTFEFQVVSAKLGIAHPTGYPLYILLGKLFSLLPFGSLAWRVNLTSAVFAAIVVALLFRLTVRVSGDRGKLPEARFAAGAAALALGFVAVFWSQAVVAEVYALNALLVMIILTLVEHILSNRATTEQPRSVYLLLFVFGVALTHHLDSLILAPAILLALLLARPRLSPRAWMIAGAWLLLGLTPWLYLPLRWPFINHGEWMSVDQFVGWILGQRFAGALNLFGFADPVRWQIIARVVGEQFTPVGSLLALAGLPLLLRRAWRFGLVTLAVFGGYLLFGLDYGVPDIAVFIIPALLVLALWLGCALVAAVELARAVARRLPGRREASGAALAVLLAILLPLLLLAGNWGASSERGRDADLEAWGRGVLALPLAPHSAILADSEKIAPLYYLQVAEGLRSDVEVVVLGDESLYRQELDRRLAAGQTVYLARFIPGLPYPLHSVGPLVQVGGEASMPGDFRAMSADFGGAIALKGISVHEGNPISVEFIWEAGQAERPNYHLRLRLVDTNGAVWWQDRGNHPVGGYYPTGAWRPGESVTDYHEIAPEPYVPEGDYALQAGWFVPWKADGLKTPTGNSWFEVARVHWSPPEPNALAVAVRAADPSAGWQITSVEPIDAVPAGRASAIRVNSAGRSSVRAKLSVVDATGSAISTEDVELRPGQARLAFSAPSTRGDYALRLDFPYAVRCGWLAPLASSCTIGRFRILGESNNSAVNFDDRVLLTAAMVDRDVLNPGQELNVKLTWQGLARWDADYTVFVHLVGPDAKLHGQVDQFPVEGTLPTSTWAAAQIVEDAYTLQLKSDAPPGRYEVEVGWYSLSTLRRLPVLDSSGAPVDDHALVGEFRVP